MVLQLKPLFSSAQEKLEFEFSFSLSDVEWDGLLPFTTPIQIKGAVTNRAGIVTCEYVADYSMDVMCDRCLRELKQEFSQRFSHVLVPHLENEAEDSDELLLVEGQQLDMEQLATDDILLNLPAKILCDPDCKGLCPKCGANLNDGDCGCRNREIDPRLEALRSLLDETS